MRGVVAAGHPLTAEAGADVLREGGNAVDAAVACVLMSFVAESPLTGPGAGGFMLVHTAPGEDHLLDFFVAAPGCGLDDRRPAALTPIDIHFSDDAVQRFNIGPSSCGAYGTTLGLAQALERFGTVALRDLTERPARAARDGVEVVPMQAFLFTVLEPIMRSTPECSELYAPGGTLLEEGGRFCAPAMMGVAYRDRERVGRIGRLRIGLRQQHADHHANLSLLSVPGADDRLLHQVGRIFRNRQSGDRRHQHGDAARLSELEGCGRILVDEGRLDGSFVGRMLFHHPPQAVVDGEEPCCEAGPVVGRKRAASQKAQAIAIDRHHAPAGAAEPGIDAEDANRPAHDASLIALPAIPA